MNLDNARPYNAGLPSQRPGKLAANSSSIIARRQLEASWQPSHRRSWLQSFKALGSKLLASLTQGQAPRITSITTTEGLQWRVYDPVGDRTYHFTQESEVRSWLEQRYYLD